jgi:SAM-dependent methyltransferase
MKSKTPRTDVAPYTLLAEYYDDVFVFANPWRESARERMLGRILSRAACCCDLACGTGATAVDLAKRGLSVYAVDLSPSMCELARRKARREGVEVTVIEADMRRFRLPEKVDLITCEFDALNHVPRQSDLARVARCAARALKPGGHFYFDVNTRLAFEEVWPLTWFVERPGLALVMHGDFDPRAGRAWTTAEFFIQRGGLWERRSERVEEVCWSQEEIAGALTEAGFDRIQCRDAAPFFGPDSLIRRGHRSIYLARRSVLR